MTERFCSDCVHRRRVRHWSEYIMYPIATWRDGTRWICARAEQERQQESQDPVTGQVRARHVLRNLPSCKLEREYDCGPNGKFWRPRDTKKHLFTVIRDGG